MKFVTYSYSCAVHLPTPAPHLPQLSLPQLGYFFFFTHSHLWCNAKCSVVKTLQHISCWWLHKYKTVSKLWTMTLLLKLSHSFHRMLLHHYKIQIYYSHIIPTDSVYCMLYYCETKGRWFVMYNLLDLPQFRFSSKIYFYFQIQFTSIIILNNDEIYYCVCLAVIR